MGRQNAAFGIVGVIFKCLGKPILAESETRRQRHGPIVKRFGNASGDTLDHFAEFADSATDTGFQFFLRLHQFALGGIRALVNSAGDAIFAERQAGGQGKRMLAHGIRNAITNFADQSAEFIHALTEVALDLLMSLRQNPRCRFRMHLDRLCQAILANGEAGRQGHGLVV